MMHRRQAGRQKKDPFQDAQIPVGGQGAGQSLSQLFKQARRRGVLHLSNRGLQEAPEEMFCLADHLESDEKFWEVCDLTRVDLGHNQLQGLPPAIENLTFLQALTLRGNQITLLPDELYKCTALTSLDLSSNQLKDLGEGMGALTLLVDLQLSSNSMTALPESIGLLSNLEQLKVESNRLSFLPDSMARLSRLQTLSAAENHIQEIGSWAGYLQSLRLLDLRQNEITQVDPSMSGVRSLVFLDLRENRLAYIPPLPAGGTLSQLLLGFNRLSEIDGSSLRNVANSLTELHLQNNQLRSLPLEIGALVKLKTLDLQNNDLSDLLPALGYLPELNRIILDGNPLRAVRRALNCDSIHDLKKYLRTRGPPPDFEGVDTPDADELFEIQANGAPEELQADLRDAVGTNVLSLKNRNFVDIPESIYNFPNVAESLNTLELNGNKIQTIPDALCERLKALQVLDLSSNQVTSISPALGWLKLKRLLLQGNRMSEDTFAGLHPNAVGGLSPLLESLQELDLRNNMLRDIPGFIFHCRKMQTLLLGYNRLGSLSHCAWYDLKDLNNLDLSNNRITDIGKGLELLPKLGSLDLQNNEISIVPPELGLCKDLRALLLAGNPQRGVRQNVMDKGTVAILEYLKMRLPEDYKPVAPPQSTESNPPQPGSRQQLDYGAPADAARSMAHQGGNTAFDQNQYSYGSDGSNLQRYSANQVQQHIPKLQSQYDQRQYSQGYSQHSYRQPEYKGDQVAQGYHDDHYSHYPDAQGLSSASYAQASQQSYGQMHGQGGAQPYGQAHGVSHQPYDQMQGAVQQSYGHHNNHQYQQQQYQQQYQQGYANPTGYQAGGQVQREQQGTGSHQQAAYTEISHQVENLNAEIYMLEQQLEDFSISEAKKYALKKQLALKRASRNKFQRQLA